MAKKARTFGGEQELHSVDDKGQAKQHVNTACTFANLIDYLSLQPVCALLQFQRSSHGSGVLVDTVVLRLQIGVPSKNTQGVRVMERRQVTGDWINKQKPRLFPRLGQ